MKETKEMIMERPPRVSGVRIDDTELCFVLEDGREISVPISFYPTLALASQKERENFEIYPVSVHWPDLDADIGSDALLLGAKEFPAFAAKAVERAKQKDKKQKMGVARKGRIQPIGKKKKKLENVG